MTERVGTRERRAGINLIAPVIFVVNLVILLSGIALIIISDGNVHPFLGVAWSVSALIYNILALLIISRHPRHTVGWIFFIVGFFNSIVVFNNLGISGLEPRIESDIIRVAINSFNELAWIIALFVPLTLVLQVFPDGRLPSRRWWPVTVGAVLFIFGMFAPFVPEIFNIHLDIYLSKTWQGRLENLLLLPGLVGIPGSLAAVIVRYRRSSGHERSQMKWLVYTAVIGISLGLIINVFLRGNEVIIGIYVTMLPTVLAMAIGIAILRHRLFDIDVIIRRTLQYAILTGILALIYFGVVVGLQSVFSTVGDQQSPIFIVISTLVIAGLFNPLRLRIQDIIDRRFYRNKFEAEQALTQFAATARDEVDLEALSTALVALVQETIQPEHISLWLAGPGMERSP